MLDIMYYYGNDSTKELAVVMGKKEQAPKSPSGMPTSPSSQSGQRHSSSTSNNGSIYNPTGDQLALFNCVCIRSLYFATKFGIIYVLPASVNYGTQYMPLLWNMK